MKTPHVYGSFLAVIASGAIALAIGQQTSKSAVPHPVSQNAPAADGMVGVYVTSVARQISFADLQKAYPANRAGRVDPVKMRADAIVGWYDTGNSYHQGKMEKNLAHVMGAERIQLESLKGTALR